MKENMFRSKWLACGLACVMLFSNAPAVYATDTGETETEPPSAVTETTQVEEATTPPEVTEPVESTVPENTEVTEPDVTEPEATEPEDPIGDADDPLPTDSPEPTESSGPIVSDGSEDDTYDEMTDLLPGIGLDDEDENVDDEDENEEEPEQEKISIGSIEELALIGTSEDYPLDGYYELTVDIYGGSISPIGSAESPFSGTFDGCGHVIAGLTISGTDNVGLFGTLTGQVCNLTLADISVSGFNAGILAGEANGATIKNVLVAGMAEGPTAGAVAGIATNTTLDQVIYFTGTNLPAVGSGSGSGALMLRSQPPYIAIVLSQTAQLAPDGNIGRFTFSHFSGENGFTLTEGDGTTILTPEFTGKFPLTAVYTCDVAGTTVELKVEIPVIISFDLTALEELGTIDGVFYEQLGADEIVQVSALEPLQLLEGVFSEVIINEEQTVTTEEDAVINLISTWEQFKNIGNTDYNPNYTMSATYLLDADISSDGEPFEAIGTEDDPFCGVFDGRVYTIDLSANPEIDRELPYYGLFGVVQEPEESDSDDTTSETEPATEPDATVDETAEATVDTTVDTTVDVTEDVAETEPVAEPEPTVESTTAGNTTEGAADDETE